MLGARRALLVPPPLYSAGSSLVDPTIVYAGVGTDATNKATFVTTADIAAGDAFHIVHWGTRSITSITDGPGHTYDLGTAATQFATLHDAFVVITTPIASGSTITVNLSGSTGTTHIVAVKYPSGGAHDIEGTTATSGVNVTTSSVTIAARNSSPQYIGMFLGLAATSSTANTPTDWFKLGASATGLGVTYYWRRVTDATSIGPVSITHSSTQSALGYRTLVSD